MAGSTGKKHWMMESMAQYPRLFHHFIVITSNYVKPLETILKTSQTLHYHKMMFCCCSELGGKSIYTDWFNEKYRNVIKNE